MENNIQKQASVDNHLQQNTKPLNTDEASKYLGLSKSYLFKLTSQNKLVYYKPNGKLNYYLKSDLDNWMLRNRRKADYEIEREAIDYVTFGGSNDTK